jgi:antitoxin component YwqK of YwqJK toxin-antitoxin module
MINKKEMVDDEGFTIKFHANGITRWSKGKFSKGVMEGYWEWYRLDGTLKRSGYFSKGIPVGDWVTYDKEGKFYKKTVVKE